MCAGILMLALWPGYPVRAQEASPVHVHVAFDERLSPRFTTVAQSAVEAELSVSLAGICTNSELLRHWTYDSSGSTADDSPQIQVSVFPRNGSYFMGVKLKHKPPATTAVPNNWEAELFSPEYLSGHGGLPMNRYWIAPVKTAFQGLLPLGSKGREILKALQTYVALGTSVVMVPPKLVEGSQAAAVLPLAFEHYQDIAMCQFRIVFHKPTMLITLHAAGAGGGLDLTPDAPQYKALLVLHKTWQMGALDPVDITQHLNDLAPLNEMPSEFYLDPQDCLPGN
jgi:hypothetical protein